MLKKLFYWFKDEFELSYSETKDLRNFTIGLAVIAVLSTGVSYILENTYGDLVIEKYQEDAEAKQRKWALEKRAKAMSSSKYSLKLDFFDPNKIDQSQLQSMGIPAFVARNLINFRNKGMVYKTKEDVAKVYGLDSLLYLELEPFIQLPALSSQEDYRADRIVYERERIEEEAKPKFKKYVYERPEAFDLNSASIKELTQIKGIGEVFAKRIINYRDILGGFHSIEQVKETYNLPAEAYDSLAVVAIINTTHKKVNINSIEIGTFKHPYLKYYQIKGIVNYRKQHGDFQTFDDLNKLKVLDNETLSLIKPYISFTD